MQDPTAPIVLTAADVEPSKVAQLSSLQTALNSAQAADRSAGKAVTKPAGYRIATDAERADFIKRAKAQDAASRVPNEKGELGPTWAGQLDAGAVLFDRGWWWVKP